MSELAFEAFRDPLASVGTQADTVSRAELGRFVRYSGLSGVLYGPNLRNEAANAIPVLELIERASPGETPSEVVEDAMTDQELQQGNGETSDEPEELDESDRVAQENNPQASQPEALRITGGGKNSIESCAECTRSFKKKQGVPSHTLGGGLCCSERCAKKQNKAESI